ncbi:MAG: OmpA family protein [Clostridiales bacterium]|nr:OmpA family protein [Candidatus Apopatocola equi]
MKRAGYRGRTPESAGEQGFWPSYADMMSALALILFFLMLLSYIQNLITGNDLQSTQKLLESTREELALTLSEMGDAGKKLGSLTGELDRAQLKLDLQQEEIAGYSLKIDEQTETIASQQKLIGDQARYLKDANEEIVAMRDQMQTIAVLRLSILEQIRASIADVMGDAGKVSIGENGNIILSEGILFDLGSAEIRGGSQKVLNELIDVFADFLSDEENARYVDSIVISGHTDSTGTGEVNRELSTDRANAVLNYLLNGKNGKLKDDAGYFCAAGYGATRPVRSNDTEEGRSANRRIEISMILRDETVLDIVDQYLALDLPESSEKVSEQARRVLTEAHKLINGDGSVL